MVRTRKSLPSQADNPDHETSPDMSASPDADNKVKRLLKKLAVDGTDALKGGRDIHREVAIKPKGSPNDKSHTYRYRGAAYVIDDSTKDEWVASQPLRWKRKSGLIGKDVEGDAADSESEELGRSTRKKRKTALSEANEIEDSEDEQFMTANKRKRVAIPDEPSDDADSEDDEVEEDEEEMEEDEDEFTFAMGQQSPASKRRRQTENARRAAALSREKKRREKADAEAAGIPYVSPSKPVAKRGGRGGRGGRGRGRGRGRGGRGSRGGRSAANNPSTTAYFNLPKRKKKRKMGRPNKADQRNGEGEEGDGRGCTPASEAHSSSPVEDPIAVNNRGDERATEADSTISASDDDETGSRPTAGSIMRQINRSRRIAKRNGLDTVATDIPFTIAWRLAKIARANAVCENLRKKYHQACIEAQAATKKREELQKEIQEAESRKRQLEGEVGMLEGGAGRYTRKDVDKDAEMNVDGDTAPGAVVDAAVDSNTGGNNHFDVTTKAFANANTNAEDDTIADGGFNRGGLHANMGVDMDTDGDGAEKEEGDRRDSFSPSFEANDPPTTSEATNMINVDAGAANTDMDGTVHPFAAYWGSNTASGEIGKDKGKEKSSPTSLRDRASHPFVGSSREPVDGADSASSDSQSIDNDDLNNQESILIALGLETFRVEYSQFVPHREATSWPTSMEEKHKFEQLGKGSLELYTSGITAAQSESMPNLNIALCALGHQAASKPITIDAQGRIDLSELSLGWDEEAGKKALDYWQARRKEIFHRAGSYGPCNVVFRGPTETAKDIMANGQDSSNISNQSRHSAAPVANGIGSVKANTPMNGTGKTHPFLADVSIKDQQSPSSETERLSPYPFHSIDTSSADHADLRRAETPSSITVAKDGSTIRWSIRPSPIPSGTLIANGNNHSPSSAHSSASGSVGIEIANGEDKGRAEAGLVKARMQGESKSARRRRVIRELKVMERWDKDMEKREMNMH